MLFQHPRNCASTEVAQLLYIPPDGPKCIAVVAKDVHIPKMRQYHAVMPDGHDISKCEMPGRQDAEISLNLQ